MIWQLVLVALIIWGFYYRWQRRGIYKVYKELRCNSDHITQSPIFGVAPMFVGSNEDRMKTIQKLGRVAVKQEGIISVWMVDKLYVVISEPIIADIVLKSCLEKDDATMRFTRRLVGDGSLFAPVNIWRPRRKIAVPIFSIKNLNPFIPVFQEQASIMVQLMEKEAGAEDFSVWNYITTYTFDAICKTSMGEDLHSLKKSNHPFLEAFEVAVKLTAKRLCSPWLYWDFVYERLPDYKELTSSRDFLHAFVDKLIHKKLDEQAANDGIQEQQSKDGIRTLLEMLIQSSGGINGYTPQELREEVLVLILAGTDTSAVATAYTALMLSRYPQVQEKLYKELKEVFGETDRPMTVQDLPRLKYLEAVIKETLRLYPAVPAIVREVTNDVTLPSGVTLVNGVGILMNFWAIHRHPAYWGDDAEQFRPERFLEGPLKHPAQFMPFSYSMRNCIGPTYAMMSMKTVLSTLLRRYRLLPPSDLKPHQWTKPLRVEFDIMMKHVDKFILRIEHRNTVQNQRTKK